MEFISPRRAPDWSKAGMAQAVETAHIPGLLVPTRYTFEQASELLRKNQPVLARSEHPDEAIPNGPSGLFSSVRLDTLNTAMGFHHNIEEVLSEYFRFYNSAQTSRIYAKLAGLSFADYVSQLHYSFWQYIPGYNLTVCEDTIPHRYFISARYQESGLYKHFEAIAEPNNEINIITTNSKTVPNIITPAIAAYIQLQKRFFPSGRALVELQEGDDGNQYFLQTHLLRPYDPRELIISEKQCFNKIDASFVRGTTHGKVVRLNGLVGYGWNDDDPLSGLFAHEVTPVYGELIRQSNFTSFDFPSNPPLREYAALRCTAFIQRERGTLAKHFDVVGDGHGLNTVLHKPMISFIVNGNRYIEMFNGKLERVHLFSEKEPKQSHFYAYMGKVVVWSDGRQGWVGVTD